MEKRKEKTEFVSAVLPSTDVRKLEELAALADRSRSAELRLAVREHVQREQAGATA